MLNKKQYTFANRSVTNISQKKKRKKKKKKTIRKNSTEFKDRLKRKSIKAFAALNCFVSAEEEE